MRSILRKFPTEKVKIHKPNGEMLQNVEALIDSKKIYIENTKILINDEDIIERTLPNGSVERFVVMDRGFYKGMHGIPDHYQLKVEKESIYNKPEKSSSSHIYNISNESGRVNINSTDNSKNYTLSTNDEQLFMTLKQLADSIENGDEVASLIEDMRNSVGEASYKEKYNDFIQSIANHMTIFAPFIPTLASFLAK